MAGSSFRPRDVLLLVLLALTWGNSFLFIKIAVSVLPPLWVVTLRMVIGGGLLAVIAAVSRRPLPRDLEVLAVLAFVGLAGAALPWAGQAWAQQFLDSGLVSVLNSFTPVVTLAFAVLAGQERLNPNRVTGLGIAVLGTLIVIRGEVGSGRSLGALGVAVLSTTGYAISAVVTRARLTGRVSNLHGATGQLCSGALALAPFALAVNGPPALHVAPVALGALLALGVFGTGFAFLAYFALIESVGATNTSMVTYLAPIVGVVSGAVFRGERLGVNVLAGGVALVFGVWLSQRRAE